MNKSIKEKRVKTYGVGIVWAAAGVAVLATLLLIGVFSLMGMII